MTDTTISQATYDALVAELHELTTTGRIEIAKAIESARALGDLSENGDYHAAKDAQGKMEARVRQLQSLLENAVVVTDEGADVDSVRPGLVVALRYEDDDEVSEYFLGSIEERLAGVEVVSPTSPLGQALIGAAAGDLVEYQAPGGRLKVEVVAIRRA
ncbi:MAG: GreA/GreB family elongation factor [Ferrimicrobium sp.]|uniref:GreA/GreB family elongation factor n=1 Tax=Ferrimicrobium sp. TaxID=2926050 RepID=UPI00262BCE7B|nr:transcription elongation factor GreA [Ferrimicrobium sp.]